ncbi:MAG: hypothetical protein WCL57_07980 [Chloroflexota bacterium]
MPFNSSNRVGIANLVMPNARQFASTVLGLPSQAPIYQQQLWHNMNGTAGPNRAATEMCGATNDNDANDSYVIRQLTTGDGTFMRENWAAGQTHAQNNLTTPQIYYFGNETDMPSLKMDPTAPNPPPYWGLFNGVYRGFNNCSEPSISGAGSNLSQAESNALTAQYAFPGAINWSPRTGNNSNWLITSTGQNNNLIVDPQQMAASYVSKLTTSYNGNLLFDNQAASKNKLLPPSPVSLTLGTPGSYGVLPFNNNRYYWQEFYDKVRDLLGVANMNRIGMLHLHYYSYNQGNNVFSTLQSDFARLDDSVNWFRTRYFSGGTLPLDVLISENAPRELGAGLPTIDYWRRGWSDTKIEFGWWNSYLSHLFREYPQGKLNSGKTVFSCVHGGEGLPFVDTSTWTPQTIIYQNMNGGGAVIESKPKVIIDGLTMFSEAYSFPCAPNGNWNTLTSYYRTPFAATMATWSKISLDTTVGTLAGGQNWELLSSQAGTTKITTFCPPISISGNGAYSICVPVVKLPGTFGSSQIRLVWKMGGNAATYPTAFYAINAVVHFPDTPSNSGYYASMIFPFVLKNTNGSQTIQFAVERYDGVSNPAIRIGKPIVSSGVTWWGV